ncbi:BatD family protein [Vibrio sp. PP-XX7]
MVNTDKRQKRGATLWIMLAGLLIGLLISLTSHAATYATVSKNKVTRNELFRLQIITDQKASSDDLDLTTLNKDFYVDRPSFGTSVNIINGSRSVHSQWDVSIAATRSGIVTIPSFTINGQKTQPIAIQVGNDATLPRDHDIVEIDSTLDKSTLYPNESTLFHFKLLFKTDPSYLQDSEIIPLR